MYQVIMLITASKLSLSTRDKLSLSTRDKLSLSTRDKLSLSTRDKLGTASYKGQLLYSGASLQGTINFGVAL